MAALYLHNSIWIPETPDSVTPTHAPHTRTISAATIQSLQSSDQTHRPLLTHSASFDSEASVAYLDLLSRQPSHPNEPPSAPFSLHFDGDPTNARSEKERMDRLVRKRLRGLKRAMAVMEIIMVCWSVYTTVRYFLAYTTTGKAEALALGTCSIAAFAVIVISSSIPLIQDYALRYKGSVGLLPTLRHFLRFFASFLLVSPAIVNLALVVVWKDNTLRRCKLDIDVVWHDGCSFQGAWFTLVVVRMIVTLLFLIVYHVCVRAYHYTRRPSRRKPSVAGSTTVGSPPMSADPLLPPSHSHQPSTSTITHANSQRRSLRSSRTPSVRTTPSPSSEDARLPQEDDFDPYAEQPDSADEGLHTFVERLRSLVAQAREDEQEPRLSAQLAEPAYRASIGYDEFGRPYPPEEHIRILNSYIRRMPTIESIGSREMTMTAGTSVAASSLYQERISSLHTVSRPPTRAMTDRDTHSDGTPSRANSLSFSIAELRAATNAGLTQEGLAQLGEVVGRVKRSGSVSTGVSTGTGTFFSSSSPLQTPIVEEPFEEFPGPLAATPSTVRPPRPLPRPPSLPRADSI
ncbi:unnamed protein product [Mycena citricolor]|uniref:Transmembrane protein n=1 Tax=Mycena citricolor TaxID=2018698 RepID=A0AAD2H9F4_9AGAR|nr:unnamed protein product [Mycena citricolor]